MKKSPINAIRLACKTIAVLSLATASLAANATAPALKSYGAASPTVAGVSSGGDMAIQMQVAYSGTIKGAAIFAGAPYYCAQDSSGTATTTCAKGSPAIPVSTLEADTDQWALNGWIDATKNIASQNVYLFSGTKDNTVSQTVMNATDTYLSHYTSSANITYNKSTAAAHGWVTWKSGTGINNCGTTGSPYLINCGIDPEQVIISKLYGSVVARSASASGQMLQFDQTAFVPGGNAAYYSLDTTGYIYVPSYCATYSGCKVMVAMHGCQQGYSFVGNAFINNSGLNEYADTNHILVVYPQAVGSRATTSYNPYGCWDWWGYTGTNYPIKSGVQPSMIKAIIDRVMAAHY